MDKEILLEAMFDGNDEMSESQSCAIPAAGDRNTVYMERVDETTCRKDSSDCCSSQINVGGSVENLHLGTQLIFSGPVIIKGVTKNDILNVNLGNSNAKLDNKKHRSKKFMARRNMGLCVLSGVVFTFLHIIILFVYHKYATSNKVQTPHYYNMNQLSKINHDMKNFVARSWGLNNKKCLYQCATKKSIVRFSIGKSFWSDCFDNDEQCIQALEKELQRSLERKYDDIYYNYIIGLSRNNSGSYIYEGRSLACQFSDKLQEHYHNSIITVGIGDCFPTEDWLIFREVQAINDLLHHLTVNGILIENYSLELPTVCKEFAKRYNDYTQEKLSKVYHEISFYDEDIFNISSPLDQKISQILNFIKFNNNSSREFDLQKSSSTCWNERRKPKIYIEKLIIKYFLITVNESFTGYFNCRNAQHLKSTLKYPTEVNYFIFLPPWNIACEDVSLNCSQNLNISKEINIAVFRSSKYNKEADDSIVSFSNILNPVVKSIKYSVDYTVVRIEISSEFDNISFIKNYYEQLSIFYSPETLNLIQNIDDSR